MTFVQALASPAPGTPRKSSIGSDGSAATMGRARMAAPIGRIEDGCTRNARLTGESCNEGVKMAFPLFENERHRHEELRIEVLQYRNGVAEFG